MAERRRIGREQPSSRSATVAQRTAPPSPDRVTVFRGAAGNAAMTRMIAARPPAGARAADRGTELDRALDRAVETQDWMGAARALTEMQSLPRRVRLGALPSDARAAIRDAAAALDPSPKNLVVQEVEALEALPSPRSAAPPQVEDVGALPAGEKLSRAWAHCRDEIGPSVAKEIEHLFSRQSLAMLAVFAGVYIAAQLTPVGWVADAFALATLTITAIFIGATIFEVAKLLVRFFAAVNATTADELRASGKALADAIAKVGVAVVVALVSRGMRGRGGGQPLEEPPPVRYADCLTQEGFVVRMPVQVAESVAAAGPTTLQRAASYMVATTPPGSSGGGGDPQAAGGGGSGAGPPPGRVSGPEVFGELTAELALEAARTEAGGVAEAVADAEQAGLTGPRGAPGTADLAVQPHGKAPAVRAAQGVSGADVQSAHIGPTSALRRAPGYSRSGADTALLDRSVHGALDRYWLDWARAQRRAGRTQVPASELYRVMLDAIQQTPGIAQRTKNAMSWRLQLELFRDLGLAGDTPLDLPFPNIKPGAAP